MRSLNTPALGRAAAFVALAVWAAACSGCADSPTPPSCSFTVSPGSASHAASGGVASVRVTTTPACSWTATSDADWITVTGGSSGEGGGTVTYSVAPNSTTSTRSASIRVVGANDRGSGGLHLVTQQGTDQWLAIRGTYTFEMRADPGGTCGWPVTTFIWPVSIQVASYLQGTTVGTIVFPPTPANPSNTWSLYASPARTQLIPGQGSPGTAAAAYNLVVDGGHWEAGGPTRAPDGRGQITNGTATGARLVLRLPGSEHQWQCSSDVMWSLLIRWADPD